MGIKVYKNTVKLDKLNGDRMTQELDRSLYKFMKNCERDLKSSDKYVPVASGDLKRSIHTRRNGVCSYEMSSINYPSKKSTSRYDDMGSNKQYKIKSGSRIIPAGKNAGKGKWFDKVIKKNKPQLKDTIDRIVKGK